jgi:transcriptional regulator CtsR
MKKLITLILGITLVYSCSTSSDENGNTTTIVAPLAPSNLIGNCSSDSQINLSWTDNSTNETGFKIERKTITGAYIAVASTAFNTTTYNDIGLTPNTTYTYRVYSNNAGGNSLTYSNEITVLTTGLPIAPSDLTGTIVAFSNQINLSWIDNSINESGFKIERKTGTGNYVVVGSSGTNVSTFNDVGLTPSTTYTYRVYSFNSVGNSTTNSNEFTIITDFPTVTDVDGNTYQTVDICNQFWTKTNLNVSKYRNGDIIPQVTDTGEWHGLTTGAWCYYGNDSANGIVYGKLYNWYAVVDPRGLAPLGYHIPTKEEWNVLNACPESSGFTGLPGGIRQNDVWNPLFDFIFIGTQGNYWSVTEQGPVNSATQLADNVRKYVGCSVRCIKD